MKRYTGQKALYEAISRSRAKARHGNILERFLPEGGRADKPALQEEQPPVEPSQAPPEVLPAATKEPSRPLSERLRELTVIKENAKLRRLAPTEKTEAPPEEPVPAPKPKPIEKLDRPTSRPGSVQTWWRLKPVQLNAGRVEIAVPYRIGVVVVLAVLLVILAAFRTGQKHPGARAKAAASAKAPTRATPQNPVPEAATTKPSQSNAAPAASSGTEPARKEGDHWIVLARHRNEADLAPVVEHFKKNDIELRIYQLEPTRKWFSENGLNAAVLPSGDGYLLTTRYLYGNPDKPGTDGFDMKQKIRIVGATYKAPPGREPFATKQFDSAYGMKVTK